MSVDQYINIFCFSSGRNESEDDEEDARLFFPTRNEEKEAILRKIQTLNQPETEESRESSVLPEEEEERSQTSEVMEELVKMAKPERSIPLVIAVAEAARNPRIRGKPSRLRDLQQPVPMEENKAISVAEPTEGAQK